MQPDTARFQDRLSRVRKGLLTDGIEVLIFFNLNNIRYLTGFTGSDGALLLSSDRSLLLVDGRYTTQARGEAREAEVIQYHDKMEGVAGALRALGIRVAGFEAPAVSFAGYANLKDRIPEIRLEPISADRSDIRTIKDDGEIGLLREAADIASRALPAALDFIKPGLREKDFALELEYRLRQNGAERASFAVIVASGINSALPHAAPGKKELAAGDAVVIDFGAVYEGYHSDETCTFFLGKASARQKTVYDTVREAHDRALGAVKAGVPCSEIDSVARECIKKNGLGDFFSHGTGHGVGLDVHEAPRLAASSKAVLEKGMVVTVEPGVYIPGLWGVRIEDTVLVREDDCEVLTKTPKDFKIL